MVTMIDIAEEIATELDDACDALYKMYNTLDKTELEEENIDTFMDDLMGDVEDAKYLIEVALRKLGGSKYV